jgi:enoyl-CoA hydratase
MTMILRCVLPCSSGHGDNFSRGIDVGAFAPLVTSGRSRIEERGMIDPLAKAPPVLSKPLVVVVHGDTWNTGHELHLAADIRIVAADTVFGQDESTHGRFLGGGATIRFVREAGERTQRVVAGGAGKRSFAPG